MDFVKNWVVAHFHEGASLNFIRCVVIPELSDLLLYVFIHVILSSTKSDVMFQWTRLEKFYMLTPLLQDKIF